MNLNRVYLVGLWLEAFFYGLNSMLVWSCLSALVYLPTREKNYVKKTVIAFVVTQYLVSTTDIASGLRRLIVAFIERAGPRSEPNVHLSDNPDPLNIVQIFLISTNSILNNCVIVWRCYHVWGNNRKVIALPAVLIIATLACAIGQAIAYRTSKPSSSVYSSLDSPWNTATYSLSCSTSTICTGLVAFRIWLSLRTTSIESTHLRFLIFVESGMLFPIALIIGLGLYISDHVSFYIVYAQLGQLGSIASIIVFLLVELKCASNDVQSKISLTKHANSTSENYSHLTATAAMKLSARSTPLTFDVTAVGKKDYNLKDLSTHDGDGHSDMSGR